MTSLRAIFTLSLKFAFQMESISASWTNILDFFGHTKTHLPLQSEIRRPSDSIIRNSELNGKLKVALMMFIFSPFLPGPLEVHRAHMEVFEYQFSPE